MDKLSVIVHILNNEEVTENYTLSCSDETGKGQR